MKPYLLNPADALQVQAILRTHAEMQDSRINESLSIVGRLKRDDPEAGADMIDDLQDQVKVFEGDSDNLNRIADIFAI